MNKPVYVMEAHFIEKQIQIAVQELQTHYNSQLNSIKNQNISYYQLVFNKVLILTTAFLSNRQRCMNKTTT